MTTIFKAGRLCSMYENCFQNKSHVDFKVPQTSSLIIFITQCYCQIFHLYKFIRFKKASVKTRVAIQSLLMIANTSG